MPINLAKKIFETENYSILVFNNKLICFRCSASRVPSEQNFSCVIIETMLQIAFGGKPLLVKIIICTQINFIIDYHA